MTAQQDPGPFPAPDDGFGGALPPADRPYGAAVVASSTPGTAALVVGALALLLCWTVVAGVLLGGAALVLARRSGSSGRATSGAVLGGLGLLGAVALVVAAVLFLRTDTGTRLRDCLDRAEGDGRARSQCQQELQDSLAG